MTRILFALIAVVGTVACGHSPAAPAAPSQTPSGPSIARVTVTGPAALPSPGQSVQLNAQALYADGSTGDVTTLATWSSNNTSIATISPAGMVTDVGTGSATMTAVYRGYGDSHTLVTPLTSGPIAACGVVVGDGPFTLSQDLTPTSKNACLVFGDSTNVVFDCQGHDAGSVSITNAHGFTLRNCALHGGIANSGTALRNLSIASSTSVVVDGVDALGQVAIAQCANCTLSHDTFVYPRSGFDVPGGFVSCELCFSAGSNSVVTDSTIDGGYNGDFATYQRQGCDDGILLNREVNLTLRGNTIRASFDAGVEATTSDGPVTITADNNRLMDNGYTGFGGYYVEGWQNSIFSNNVVSNTPSFLHFDSSAAAGVTTATLVNNQIIANTLVNQSPQAPIYQSAIPASIFIAMTSRASFTVSGNLIQNNNFGTASYGPVLSPASGFIDGGGNICSPSTTIVCSPSGVARALFSRPGRR